MGVGETRILPPYRQQRLGLAGPRQQQEWKQLSLHIYIHTYRWIKICIRNIKATVLTNSTISYLW